MRLIASLILIFATTFVYANGNNKQLIFFFDSRCPYCHKMAPIVIKIAQKYNIPVIGNSMDDRPINEFPNASYDDNLAKTFKIESLPTVAGIDEKTKEMTIVMVGLQDESSFENNIITWLGGDSSMEITINNDKFFLPILNHRLARDVIYYLLCHV